MKKNRKPRYALFLLLIAALIGWLIGRKIRDTPPEQTPSIAIQKSLHPKTKTSRARPVPLAINQLPDGTTVEIYSSQNPNEVIIRFLNFHSYQTFLTKLTSGNVFIVSRLDRLHAIRLGFQEIEDLANLLQKENIHIAPSLSQLPEPSPEESATHDGHIGFGDTLLEWLGVHSDHSAWGRDVRIAVLDSGIVPHENIPGLVKSLAITPFPLQLSHINGHGTAMASLIAGISESAPGLAPSAALISIRVSNDKGKADCFAMAAGILTAIDEGADLINISMGSEDDNPLVKDAVIYAQENQKVIIASSGNSAGIDAVYPAAYPGVISVGAVDANGTHLPFSNYGTLLTLTAPGLALNAAWPENRYVRTTGTSASAAIVTGAIAAVMSHGNGKLIRANEAAELLLNQVTDAGLYGPDTQYGFGILDLTEALKP